MFGIDDAAAALLLSGAISTAGSLYTNSRNNKFAKNANLANLQIARENNQTQIDMANTAHQREVADLRAAGLNPILSAGGNGASSPTLQAPGVQALHNENSFEGLANSARGVSRYLSQEYKAGLEAQKLSNEGAELGNTAQRIDNNIQGSQAQAMRDNAHADMLLGGARLDAVRQLLGVKTTRDGTEYYSSKRHYDGTVDLIKQAERSQIKLGANANWRANLSSFVPFTSPVQVGSGINSAASAARKLRIIK